MDVVPGTRDELDRLPDRQLFGQRDREEQRALLVVDQGLDPASVAGEGAGADGLLGHARDVEEG
mgnify:CR=1 FL=1